MGACYFGLYCSVPIPIEILKGQSLGFGLRSVANDKGYTQLLQARVVVVSVGTVSHIFLAFIKQLVLFRIKEIVT